MEKGDAETIANLTIQKLSDSEKKKYADSVKTILDYMDIKEIKYTIVSNYEPIFILDVEVISNNPSKSFATKNSRFKVEKVNNKWVSCGLDSSSFLADLCTNKNRRVYGDFMLD